MKSTVARKVLSLVVVFSFVFQPIFQQVSLSQTIAVPTQNPANAISGTPAFRPLHLRYFSYDPQTDKFQILLDKGNLKDVQESLAKAQGEELLKYFLIGVALEDNNFWVNLRPDAEGQIISQGLVATDVGKLLLEADLQLKKDMASLTSPQTPEGKDYWNKLYKKANQIFKSEDITVPTVTRPWIVPGEVIIRQTKNSAYVYKASLKVMLEQDHLKNSAAFNFSDPRLKELNEYSAQLIRQKILPKLTKEVNSSAKYAALRQVFYSLVLARWFKAKFAGEAGVYPKLIDTGDLKGLTSKEAWSKATYFQEYQKSFANGEYNIKEAVNTSSGPMLRTYFSGGVSLGPDLNIPGPGATGSVSSPIIIFSGINPDVNRAFVEGAIPLGGTAVPGAPTLQTPTEVLAQNPPVASSPVAVDKGTQEAYGELEKLARYYILRSLYLAGSGHANTALSDVNTLLALYALGGMHYNHEDPNWNYRDRFVTKGHGYMSIYTVLALMGFFPTADLEHIRELGHHLSGHVTVNTPGIDANTGILGQSLSIALGMAINANLEHANYTTFCQFGDGETQEGQIHSAAEIAAALAREHRTGKLIGLLDANRAERDGWVSDYGTINTKRKWEAFGWHVVEANGNDPFAIKAAIDLAKAVQDKPTLIITYNVKGKGVSYLSQGDNAWLRHGSPPKDAKEYFQALKEIFGREVGSRVKIQVGNKELEVDDQEKTFAQLINMRQVGQVIAQRQAENIWYRESKKEAEAANPHLKPTAWQWDKQPTRKYEAGSKKPTRQAAGDFFVELLTQNLQLQDRMPFLTMDLEESECLHVVGEKFPEMRFRMGIREDVTASVAVGLSLASQGRIVPIVGTFAAFALNMGPQLRIAKQTPGVRFIVYMSHGEALDVGADGPTHQPEYATGLTAQTLGLNTFMPPDANTMWDALSNAVDMAINDSHSGISWIGGVRGTDLSSAVYDFKLTDPAVDSFVVWQTKGIDEEHKPDGIIVAVGPAMVNMAMQAAQKLEEKGKRIRVICVQRLDAIRDKDSQFFKLVEPGVPIVTVQDALENILGELVSNALTDLPETWGAIPRVSSVGIRGIPETHGILKGVSYRGERGEALRAYRLFGMDPDGIANRIEEMIAARQPGGSASSAVSSSPAVAPKADSQDFKPGGIDFRLIPLITQPMGNFSGLDLTLPKVSSVEKINLDEEFNQMQAMLGAGDIPSGSRLKTFVAACYQKGELTARMDGIVAFLVNICKLEEERVADTPAEVKELMLILDSTS